MSRPASIPLDEDISTKVVEKLGELLPLVREFVRSAVAREIAAMNKSGDRLLTLKDVAAILQRSPQSISKGWKAGRYPFMLKDGHHLVGSQDGLDRWIKARVK
jgi:hypothetical protein